MKTRIDQTSILNRMENFDSGDAEKKPKQSGISSKRRLPEGITKWHFSY